MSLSVKSTEKGNAKFAEGDYAVALELYGCALETATLPAQIITLHSNRAACYLKLKNHLKAIEECSAVLQLEPNHVGALLLRAQAFQGRRDYQAALLDVQRFLEIKSSPAALSLEAKLKTLLAKEAELEADEPKKGEAPVTTHPPPLSPELALPTLLPRVITATLNEDVSRTAVSSRFPTSTSQRASNGHLKSTSHTSLPVSNEAQTFTGSFSFTTSNVMPGGDSLDGLDSPRSSASSTDKSSLVSPSSSTTSSLTASAPSSSSSAPTPVSSTIGSSSVGAIRSSSRLSKYNKVPRGPIVPPLVQPATTSFTLTSHSADEGQKTAVPIPLSPVLVFSKDLPSTVTVPHSSLASDGQRVLPSVYSPAAAREVTLLAESIEYVSLSDVAVEKLVPKPADGVEAVLRKAHFEPVSQTVPSRPSAPAVTVSPSLFNAPVPGASAVSDVQAVTAPANDTNSSSRIVREQEGFRNGLASSEGKGSMAEEPVASVDKAIVSGSRMDNVNSVTVNPMASVANTIEEASIASDMEIVKEDSVPDEVKIIEVDPVATFVKASIASQDNVRREAPVTSKNKFSSADQSRKEYLAKSDDRPVSVQPKLSSNTPVTRNPAASKVSHRPIPVKKMDYSKWDSLDLSDSEDDEPQPVYQYRIKQINIRPFVG